MMRNTSSCFAGLLVGLSALPRAQAKNPFPNSTTCDDNCAETVYNSWTWTLDQQADANYTFYQSPSNFSADLEPGVILQVEDSTDLTEYVIPAGLTMSMIIYTTEDLDGKVIPASAFILWPYEALDIGKACSAGKSLPMIAWAHGTTGVFGPCAPSSYRALQYHFQAPFALALEGLVVVAPDYAGLGISELPSGETIPHAWVTSPAQANDVAFAITAARKAFPELLSPRGPFVTMGHSQGGGAAWAFAERQHKHPIAGYRGTVALAPVTDILSDLDKSIQENTTASVVLAQGALIDSVSKVYPEYNYKGFTPKSYDRWFNVLAEVGGCFPTLVEAFLDLTIPELSKPDWYLDPIVKKWKARSEAGRKPFAGPLLVLGGDADSVVSLDSVTSAVEDTCQMLDKHHHANSSLEHITFSSMNHFSVIPASQNKWLNWIKDRLSGREPEKRGCHSRVVSGLRETPMDLSSAPNFFLSHFPLSEFWKYIL